jgi:hypothetical protein
MYACVCVRVCVYEWACVVFVVVIVVVIVVVDVVVDVVEVEV